MSLVFIGTVETSYNALDELIKRNIEINAVFTMDKNDYNTDFFPLRKLAEESNIKVYSFKNINDSNNVKIIKKITPDVIFAIGISQIIKPNILEIPKYGCIGFHPTLLPKDRGRAAIPWTILKEKNETGATLFYMTEGMDDGNIIAQEKIKVEPRENARTLYDKVNKNLRKIISENIFDILNNNVKTIKQNEDEATFCLKREPKDGLINWDNTAKNIDKLVRATTDPYPGAYTYYKGKKMIIWDTEIFDNKKYTAKNGQIVDICDGKGVLVMTRKKILLIKNVEYEGKNIRADELISYPGVQFDNIYDLYLELKNSLKEKN